MQSAACQRGDGACCLRDHGRGAELRLPRRAVEFRSSLEQVPMQRRTVGLSDPHRAELSKVLFRLCDEHSEQMIGSIEETLETRRRAVG